jgi:hypothetical protein
VERGSGPDSGSEPGLVGEDDELGPVPRPELDHGPADVCAYGCGTEHELLGDFVVAQTIADQAEDPAFPLGEGVESRMRMQ